MHESHIFRLQAVWSEVHEADFRKFQAEFERETIAARVKDAYSTKAVETGFYQGGKMFFGFQSSRQTINGKTGSVLVLSEAAQTVIAAPH